MPPRRNRNEEADEDNFFVSWSDLVTLLMVFFIWLFSISETDVVKFLEARESMGQEMTMYYKDEFLEKVKAEQQKLKAMSKVLNQYIQENELQDHFTVTYSDAGLEVNLGDAILFTPGKSILKSESGQILKNLGSALTQSDSKIIVEGYTDDIPIATKQYPSNWELSSARASAVARNLIAGGIPEKKFTVVGFGAQKPLFPNDSAENRAKNRRVKILVVPDQDKPPSTDRTTNTPH